jgi:tRNA-splicing ligase RtcB
MKEIKGQFNTAKVFASTVEPSCEAQILELCNEEWVYNSKIRIMADCHSGKGCVIGTTMTIIDKIVPNLTGVDIGCGVLVTKFDTLSLTLEQVDSIVKRNIPMGMNSRQSMVVDFTPELDKAICKEAFDPRQVCKSIGSLGGGNHFIEIDKDDEGNFYLVVHTGSRNFGKRVAEHYQNKAVDYHSKKGLKSTQEIINELKAKGLQHMIPAELKKRNAVANEALTYLEGDLFDCYLNDMHIAQKMASENRKAIADILCRTMHIKPTEQFETIHNYIDVHAMILRKGAISAKAGEVCLIPINMRDGSLICVGKGNEDYNYSAPHGAGRLMSRKQAKRELSLEGFKDTMKDIYSSTVGASTLDEAPDAYKPIAEILENIQDTVTVLKQIKPIYNVKAEEE